MNNVSDCPRVWAAIGEPGDPRVCLKCGEADVEIQRYAEVFGPDVTEVKAHSCGIYVRHDDHLAALRRRDQELAGCQADKEFLEHAYQRRGELIQSLQKQVHDANNELMSLRAERDALAKGKMDDR